MSRPRQSPIDVLIVGGSGLVGGLLLARFGDRARGTFCSHPGAGLIALDITDAAATAGLLEAVAPRIVVHTAALTDVNRCQREPELSRRINVDGTRNVAAAAAAIGARYVFFSTDYVFGDGGPHGLDAPRAPLNEYGRHKAEAEDIAAGVADSVVVRACNVYGYQKDGKNYAMAVWQSLSAGLRVKAAIDQWTSPTLAADLADATVAAADASLGGAVHLAGPDHVTRVQWAVAIADAFGFDASLIDAVPVASFASAAPRPSRGGLDARASSAALGVTFRSLAAGTAVLREEMERADRASG